FTTYEYIEDFPLVVIKRDKRREPYERKKLMNGIITACKKRPISIKKIEDIVDSIESEIKNLSNTEIDSIEIGKRIMNALLEIDDVAYMRFASVYRNFRDKTEFIKEVKGIDIRD
ncbi:MAG: ATP cone domain-containing protein, partial [Chitinivibrionales bacterium]